jgi:hypothetical protein
MKKWDDRPDALWLLTEAELDSLPDGTVLLSINGQKRVKDHTLDRDIRYGVLAYGLTEKLAEQQGLKDQFLLWLIAA